MSKKKSEKRRDLRFLWLSNALYTNSGYAVETRDLLKRFQADGWQLAQIANHGVESYKCEIDGITIYPKMSDPNGSDAMVYHSKEFNAHVVFVMLDLWIINPQYLDQLNKDGVKFIPYVPIDQEPVNPGVLENLKRADKIITFSQFGKDALEKHGFASKLILEGIDIDMFRPMKKDESRAKLGIPQDIFLFGMIGANKENPPRKGYQEAMDAFALFAKDHPEARLYFHCQQLMPSGFPIQPYAEHIGIMDRCIFLDQYRASFAASNEHVVTEINCFDALLHPSQTEGFGLLSVESQACGVPVIVNRCTSMPELVIENETGWICEVGNRHWRNACGYVYPADIPSLHNKMEILYKELQEPKRKKQISHACRDNVLKNYDINVIVKEQWLPFLESLQEDILPKKE